MKKTNKGFTIVELVIVIAVIAILAAVLIPTFSSAIRKANMSVDQQLVAQMNKILAADEQLNGKAETMEDVIIALGGNGIANIKASLSGNSFYWSKEDGCILIWTETAALTRAAKAGKVTYPEALAEKYADETAVLSEWVLLASADGSESYVVENVESFMEAVNQVGAGGTIAISKDMTITGSNGGDLKDTYKTTFINLNGNTVTAATGNAGFGIRNNAIANISNGTLVADANTYSAILSRYDGAVANVSNMTLGNSKQNGTALSARDNGVINVENTVINSTIGGCADANGGTINIKDCTFNQTGADTDLRSTLFLACYGGVINIDGGDYTGANKGLYIITSGGTFNVYGGSFKANEVIKAEYTNYENSYPGATAVFNIYGGSFDGKIDVNGTSANTVNIVAGTFANTGLTPERFQAYVAEGSTVTYADGVFTVTKA